jgi:hypothetical protein
MNVKNCVGDEKPSDPIRKGGLIKTNGQIDANNCKIIINMLIN